MKKEEPLQHVPLDRVTQAIYARIHAALEPVRHRIGATKFNAALIGEVFTTFAESLPGLDLSAYNSMRKRLLELAAKLGSASGIVLSKDTRATANQIVEHDLPRLAAIATKLNEEEAPKFFAALRTPDSAFGHFAIDTKKKTTIRKTDFDSAVQNIVNCRLAEFAGLVKRDVAEWLAGQGHGNSNVQVDDSGDRPRYSLRKEHGVWTLVFEGKTAQLKHERGLEYVAHLLKNPPAAPIYGSELAARSSGHAVFENQRNLATDDNETFKSVGASRKEFQAVLADPNATELEKTEAQAELEKIGSWARKHLRGTEGNEQRQVRAIRQAIRRLLDGLSTAKDEQNRPHRVLRAFGEHLDDYLWKPSSRTNTGRRSRVRAGLAGKFTYEPPSGVSWTS